MTPVPLPTQLGRYRLLKQLGQGGMGAVWLALDTELQREVALKVPHFPPGTDPSVFQRFKREAQLAAQIDHPNFCPIHDVGQDDGRPFLVMPVIKGRALSDYLRNGEPWPILHAARLIAALASALAALHQRGIVHRDLKPANVMVKETGEVVLMDFGLARSFEGSSEGLTASGQMLGTPLYMAPEQVMSDGTKVGPPADVWALGVMLYQLLAGRLPFTGSGMEVFGRILHLDPEPPSRFRPDGDTRLDTACLRALSKDARLRPAGMAAFVELLGQAMSEALIVSHERTIAEGPRPESLALTTTQSGSNRTHLVPPSPPPARSKGRLWLAGGAPVGLLILAMGLLLVQGGSGPGTTQTGPTSTEAGDQVVEGKGFENSLAMKLVWIKPGTFTMGSPENETGRDDDEGPQHRVTISKGYWMAAHEVTVGQFKNFALDTNHTEEGWKTPFQGQTDQHPVVRVSLEDALKFRAWLSKKEGREYDLPTEAEWEYACRAGTVTRYSFRDEKDLKDYAWYSENAGNETKPVGQKKANPWGLYDMHGNVWEWCKDGKREFTEDNTTDPNGGDLIVPLVPRGLRGGSWDSVSRFVRSASRTGNDSGLRNTNAGFRVVVRPAPRRSEK